MGDLLLLTGFFGGNSREALTAAAGKEVNPPVKDTAHAYLSVALRIILVTGAGLALIFMERLATT